MSWRNVHRFVCFWLTLLFLLVWYLWEPPKQIHTSNNTNRVKRSGVPETYIPWIISWTYNNSITVTVPPNTTTSVDIPIEAIRGFRNTNPTTGKEWSSSWWYLTGHVLRMDWNDLVTTQEGQYWPPGDSEEAKFFKDRVTLSHPDKQIKLTFSLPDGEIRPPNATLFNTSCWGLLLWAWSSGADPYFPIVVCVNSTMETTEQPRMNDYTRRAGVKAVSVPFDNVDNVDGWFHATTGISGNNNNWLLMAEQAGKAAKKDCVVCMGPRPLLRVVSAPLPHTCLIDVMNNTVPRPNCSYWDSIFPLAKADKDKPLFSSTVPKVNFTCINKTGKGKVISTLDASYCQHIVKANPSDFNPRSRSDVWWWCGGDKIYDRLPNNSTGICALITLILPATIIPATPEQIITQIGSILPEKWQRRKRDEGATPWLSLTDPTYIDAIGIPRGVPDEYKSVDQVAAGFESALCWWCTINKNVDRINYIHYNVQKLGNWTQEGFSAVSDQLKSTSLMAFQNRIALDMLLAEKGGVCAIFGDQCCTFIPNNTAADGRLTKAIEGLRTLNKRMKEQSGVDTTMWDQWMSYFGKYKALVSSLLLSIAVFSAVLVLCGCCCIPCIRSLLNRVITTAIENKQPLSPHLVMPLMTISDPDSDDDSEFPDLTLPEYRL